MSAELAVRDEGALATSDAGADFLGMIERAARDPQVDVAKMESLLALRERWVAKQAERAFIDAMNRLQPRLPRIAKRGQIKIGASNVQEFATYEDIDQVIRPLYSEEGFSFSFGTSPMEKGGITITATLSHKDGHSRTESMPLPFDTSGSKNSVQAVGSTMSYGKRYLTCAMLNIVTVKEDDDANSLSCIDDDQVAAIKGKFLMCDMDFRSQETFLQIVKAASVEQIKKRDFKSAMSQLNLKLRKVRASAPGATR